MNRKMVLHLMAILMVTIPCVDFTSCGSDDDDSPNNSSSLDFIQVRVYSEDVTAPNGNAYLFYVDNYLDMIEDLRPSTVLEWTPTISYQYNRETKYMTPISKYGSKYKGDLLVNENKGYSVHSIYWYELSTLYGTPKPGGKYVLMVDLRNGVYLKAYKELTITNNSIIEVHFPKASEKYSSSWIDANFIVRDYVSDY
ncbi:MAG: hypothetical protein IJK46_08745 [Prevotella sp.]|nr:hypothetical protein [Prevotella sp.]